MTSWPPWALSEPTETPGSSVEHRSPAHEVRALCHQPFEPGTIFLVVAIAEQDDAIGLAAVLVVLLPVLGQLLEGDQQVIALARRRARDRAEHRKEKGIDLRIVGSRILEQQQRQRVRVLRTQVRSVLVDAVVQLARDLLDALARLEIDHRRAAQRARNGRLTHAREERDVKGCRFFVHRSRRLPRRPLLQGGDDAQAGARKATSVRRRAGLVSNQRAASSKNATPWPGSSRLPLTNAPSGSPWPEIARAALSFGSASVAASGERLNAAINAPVRVESPERQHGVGGREEFDVARDEQFLLTPPREQTPEAMQCRRRIEFLCRHR